MNRRIRNITYLTAVIILLIAAVSYEQSFFDELSNNNISRQAQRYISAKSIEIDKQLSNIADELAAGEELWMDNIPDDFLIFVTTRNHVKFWNSNRISPEDIVFSDKLTCKKIDNAWFLYKSYSLYHFRIDVLTNIKNNYAINNEYFQNDDADQSQLSHYSISEEPQIGYNPAYGEDGKPLFYFAKTELNEHNRRHSLLATILYFILFLNLLVFMSVWHRNSYINLLSVATTGLALILSVQFFDIIPIFNRTELFTKGISLADNTMISLGMLALYSIFWLVFSYTLSKSIRPYKSNKRQALGISLLLTIAFYSIIIIYLNILSNSSIGLQLYRLRQLTSESFWVYGMLVLFIAGWGRIASIAVKSFRSHKWAYLYPIIAMLLCWPLLQANPIPLASGALFLIVILFSLRRKRKVIQYLFVHLLVASILLSFMITILTEYQSNIKNDNDKIALIKTLPASLLYERDYTVEDNLVDIWNALQQDVTIKNLPKMVFISADYYAKYLRDNYFSGHLKEYDLQVVICNPEMDLQVVGASDFPNCYKFFSERLNLIGEPIKDSAFFWQKNNNGRVSYLGWLKIAEGTLMETSLFIELESPILSEGRGYPEMLREQSNVNSALPSHYSFARYANNKLITSSGDFRYPPSDKWIPRFDGELHKTDFDKSTHLCYRVSEDNCVVITESKKTFLFPIYAYIYNFLFFYLSFLIIHLLTKKHRITLNHSISNDIRFTIFSVLFLSLILVGSTSVLFPINVYKTNQEAAMNEKGESFLNSISRELANVTNIREVPQASLQGLVQSLSNTLSNDVHIYDLDGRLYASSRPQLFNYKLQGNIICPIAYKAFKYDNLTNKMHNELIGNNVYKSSYYVISNSSEEPIAYINVPFFSSQQDLRKSLTDFVVILLNIYLILIILVIIFTFLSVNAITKPLLVMQEGLSKMRLGSNEKIIYKRDDEIGSLVGKYNTMVDELNASVEQLAKSEREVAWQRMARQIAHEIKNPLTPMKLSIQHLARTKTASPEVFDDYFNKTANTLIEQIDNLSNIATSFSTFAKISDGVPELLSVNDRLNNVVTLFAQSGSTVSFQVSEKDYFVKMDKDHFIQIFNNLIKNALQAIPEDRDGVIELWTDAYEDRIEIFVKDNGSGINEDTQEKIFQPNFTTKNSGMGLGLAISKKMTNNAGGDISFTSIADEGTTFKVQLPISTPDY